MRTLFILLFALCLTPLWAEDREEEIDRRPIVIGAVYEEGIVRASLYDVIFEVELEHNMKIDDSDQVFFSFPAVAIDYDTHWRIAFTAKPAVWSSDIAYFKRNEPISPDEYRFGGQYLSKSFDMRALVPPAYINGRQLKPLIELRYWRVYTIVKHFEVFARGKSDLEKTDFGLGLAYSAGSLEAKIIYTNLDQIDWSIGLKTQLNLNTKF